MSVSSRAQRDDEQAWDSYFVLSSKALADRIAPQLTLMSDTLQHARFDEHSRIHDQSAKCVRDVTGITGSGHALAMSAACVGMSPLARMGHEQGGLEGIRRMRALDDVLKQDGELEALSHSLSAIHRKLAAAGAPLLCTIADEPNISQASESQSQPRLQLATCSATRWSASAKHVRGLGHQYPSQLLREGHPLRPLVCRCPGALSVSGVFAKRFPASQHPGTGRPTAAVRVMTPTSPHSGSSPTETRDWSRLWTTSTHPYVGCWRANMSSSHSRRRFSRDGQSRQTGIPLGEAKRDFHELLLNTASTVSFRPTMTTTLDDLRRVADTYLKPKLASTAVITHTGANCYERGLNLTRQDLLGSPARGPGDRAHALRNSDSDHSRRP